MKLYFAPGTCSLAPHIVLRELALPFELVRVRLGPSPVIAGTAQDYRQISPLGYVPALQLGDGSVLLEGTAMLQYLADSVPDSQLGLPREPRARYELQQWLGFIATELHKTFSPWLFHPEYGEQAMTVARARLAARLALVDTHLRGRDYLVGPDFSIADAYLFAVASWTRPLNIALDDLPALQRYLERTGARDSVRAAVHAEKRSAA